MLLNQTVSAEGELPTCQDTGTAICIGHKGEDVWTGADDAECIARGVYETYKDRNLRYSQVVPFTMTDEKNSGTNLPAQIDIYGGKPGMEYEFLFIGAMWLIFAPSSGKEQQPGTDGYNTEMPDADKANRQIIGDKLKAYEHGEMEERQERSEEHTSELQSH